MMAGPKIKRYPQTMAGNIQIGRDRFLKDNMGSKNDRRRNSLLEGSSLSGLISDWDDSGFTKICPLYCLFRIVQILDELIQVFILQIPFTALVFQVVAKFVTQCLPQPYRHGRLIEIAKHCHEGSIVDLDPPAHPVLDVPAQDVEGIPRS